MRIHKENSGLDNLENIKRNENAMQREEVQKPIWYKKSTVRFIAFHIPSLYLCCP